MVAPSAEQSSYRAGQGSNVDRQLQGRQRLMVGS